MRGSATQQVPSSGDPVATSAAAERQRAQLPAFAPLVEELELAGWSSHRQKLSGNFHDWMLLGGNRVMVTVGHAVGPEPLDPVVSALVAQSAWTAVRAHAAQARDAGHLLTLADQTLWPLPAATTRASVAVVMVDAAGGHATVALAGDCMAWRVRAATSEQIVIGQPLLGGATDFTYLSHSIQLSLRERLILAAGDSSQESARAASLLAMDFSSLDAESHRRMTAADTVARARRHFDDVQDGASLGSASIAAVRRR